MLVYSLQAVDKVDRQPALAKNKNIRCPNLWHKRSTVIIDPEFDEGCDRNLKRL